MKKILIISQSHLCRNPRVWKEATILSKAGYQVSILTAIYSEALLKEDISLLENTSIAYKFYSDLRRNNLQSFFDRLIRKITLWLQIYCGIENKWSLGYGINRLKKLCRSAHADLYMMHQELPTVLGAELLKEGYPVAFDLEDWYSRDLLPEAQKYRPLKLLAKAEKMALSQGLFCITTAHAMAKAMSKAYQAPKPQVIYNVFPVCASVTTKKQNINKLFWFSQTIGTGRGLEVFIRELNAVSIPLELHLLGNCSAEYQDKLTGLMANQHTLIFHPLVSNAELPDFIARFDIGLALEEYQPESRNLTITNKLFHYIQAGLPVLATPTAGQLEILNKYRVGYLIGPGYQSLPDIITALSENEALYQELQKNVQLAAQELNWEEESTKLMAVVNKFV